MGIRKFLRSSSFVSSLYYGLHLDELPAALSMRSYMHSVEVAIKRYMPEATDQEREQAKTDIRHCYLKYKISPTEYFLFDFQKLPPEERASYLSDKMIYMTAGKVIDRKLHDEQLENKYNFYQLTQKYFKRKAILIESVNDWSLFKDFSTEFSDFIIKHNTSGCGSGIRVEHVSNESEGKAVFNRTIHSGNQWIVEELIRQSDDMASWNPSSVNTVRISSFLNRKGFFILCPFIRTGRKGSVVDNGGKGGLYAAIDEKTGRIITDGKDEMCVVYSEHPDSHVVYKGWQIPEWDELLKLAEEIHQLFPKHKYIAWDFAHTDNGWVLVEGNWGEFIAQQSTMKRGYKKEFMDLILG